MTLMNTLAMTMTSQAREISDLNRIPAWQLRAEAEMCGIGNNEELNFDDDHTSESPGEAARRAQDVAAERPRLSRRQKQK